MPSRILREGILTSEPVNSLTEKAELFYRRLMSVADDYGRYYAHPSLLRAACYPLQLDKVSEADVKQLLIECQSNHLLLIYGGGKYIAIANFKQQTRSASKYPQPTAEDLLNNGFTIDSFYTKSESYSETETDTKSRPTKDEIVDYCKSIGLPNSDGEALFDKWQGNGWRNGTRLIKDWKATIRTWKAYGYLASQKTRPPGGHPASPPRDPDVWTGDPRFNLTKAPPPTSSKELLAAYNNWRDRRLKQKGVQR